MEETTKKYELSLMLRTEEAAEAVLVSIKNQGGDVLEKNPIQKVKLSYPIKKETNAFFLSLVLSLLPEKVLALDQELKLSEYVLRFLIITPPIAKEDRSERSERFMKPKPEMSPQKTEEIKTPIAPVASEPEVLTNELLEKKLEEILG
jgi:ribosomal protein S6